MQVDKRGWIWINADDDLEIFNPATEIFRHVKLPVKNGKTNQVKPRAFYYDKEQDIMWIGTSKGLYFSKAGSAILGSAATITADTTLYKATVYTIIPANDDWLWLTSGNRIIKLNTKTGATLNYSIPEMVSGRHNGGNVFITSTYLDKNKILWLGTTSLGLFSFNTVTGQFDQYTYGNIKIEENTIFSITQTGLAGQQDILYMGATGLGFAAFNITQKKFTSYKTAFSNTSLGMKGNAYGLHNYDNKLWIGSSTGLHCYDYSLQLFEKKDISTIAGGLTLEPTALMNAERSGSAVDEKLWFFVSYKGAYVYDLLRDKVLPAPAKIKKYTSVEASVLSMYIDNKNVLWISTSLYGLVGYDIKKDSLVLGEKKYFHQYGQWVHHYFEDSRGDLWLCTFNGLFLMDSNRQKILPASTVNSLLNGETISRAVVGITEDEHGKIWITADYSDKKNAAIIQFDPVRNKATIVYQESVENDGNNPAVDIRDICSNKKGKIFVSFRNENISLFNSNATGKLIFEELGRQQGLNSTAIDQLIADSSGNIWCSNSLGIAQYKISQHSFNNYTLAAYELSTTNNPFIYISPNSGRFYIGQANGFLLFNYGNNGNDIKNTSLLFNELKIYNTVYPQKIKDGDRIVLNYRQDMISIEFALLSYSNAHENTYSWMLEGLEKNWNISKNNVATYNHLLPGEYTLLVKAANSNGDWKTIPIKLHIKIKPPFYATWWFITMVILLLTGFVWWIVQRRIKAIKEKFALRNRIASDLHDEIGSTLTCINILSNVSQQAMEQQPQQAKELLQQISSQSKTIQQNMSDIVWSIRPDNEKIENLVVRVREYAAQTLEPLRIHTIIEADDKVIDKVLPMQYRKDILLICKEAINNIAKHADAGSVTISFSHTQKSIVVTIKDNGQWKGNNSGTGTKTMQERANALGGQLSINSNEGGTMIRIQVPVP